MVMTEIMKSFRHKSILVIGDLILDRYIIGRVDRISQEAPVPIVEVTSESFRLGGAANVANNIVSLGGKASVAGLVGKDRAAEVLREILSDRGIAAEGIIEDKRPTTVRRGSSPTISRWSGSTRKTPGNSRAEASRDSLPMSEAPCPTMTAS
jgi:D-beta-D-heptose 7-phosphate kinase/D-beta-D-heptose 1-phosphate adenosyltransferase